MTRRSFVVVYSDSLGTRDEIKAFCNDVPGIQNWRYDIPNCFYVAADYTAKELSAAIHGRFGGKGQFLVLEYDHDRSSGYMTLDTWWLLQQKELIPEETKRAFLALESKADGKPKG